MCYFKPSFAFLYPKVGEFYKSYHGLNSCSVQFNKNLIERKGIILSLLRAIRKVQGKQMKLILVTYWNYHWTCNQYVIIDIILYVIFRYLQISLCSFPLSKVQWKLILYHKTKTYTSFPTCKILQINKFHISHLNTIVPEKKMSPNLQISSKSTIWALHENDQKFLSFLKTLYLCCKFIILWTYEKIVDTEK